MMELCPLSRQAFLGCIPSSSSCRKPLLGDGHGELYLVKTEPQNAKGVSGRRILKVGGGNTEYVVGEVFIYQNPLGEFEFTELLDAARKKYSKKSWIAECLILDLKPLQSCLKSLFIYLQVNHLLYS